MQPGVPRQIQRGALGGVRHAVLGESRHDAAGFDGQPLFDEGPFECGSETVDRLWCGGEIVEILCWSVDDAQHHQRSSAGEREASCLGQLSNRAGDL